MVSTCFLCIPLRIRMSLDIGFEAVHVDSAVVLILVLVFPLDVVCGLLTLPLWPDPFFQLYEASHIWGETVRLPGPRWRRLEAAVALIGRHPLKAYHGLGFTDQRNLRYVRVICSQDWVCFDVALMTFRSVLHNLMTWMFAKLHKLNQVRYLPLRPPSWSLSCICAPWFLWPVRLPSRWPSSWNGPWNTHVFSRENLVPRFLGYTWNSLAADDDKYCEFQKCFFFLSLLGCSVSIYVNEYGLTGPSQRQWLMWCHQ